MTRRVANIYWEVVTNEPIAPRVLQMFPIKDWKGARAVKFSEEGNCRCESLRRSIECSRGSEKKKPENIKRPNMKKSLRYLWRGEKDLFIVEVGSAVHQELEENFTKK